MTTAQSESERDRQLVTDGGGYVAELRANRAEKDEFFADHPQSPIPPEKREEFDGLAYFDPDPEYRVEATVTVISEPEEVEMETSDGRQITYRRPFRFEFEIDGETYELSGYRRDADDPIFVPFRDKTTGQQSYKDGRYMELEHEEELTDGTSIDIDFNLAYSPFCAYSETFSCPLPPEENWLDTTISAGERAPPLE
ncbi:DUF1684 domain-containing protein [Halovenus halobia]|uniref:DUF1684 domain-containing protein n=1 Tax=Halovenus halobia TaxID=3396622 RepID=UPI003F575E64